VVFVAFAALTRCPLRVEHGRYAFIVEKNAERARVSGLTYKAACDINDWICAWVHRDAGMVGLQGCDVDGVVTWRCWCSRGCTCCSAAAACSKVFNSVYGTLHLCYYCVGADAALPVCLMLVTALLVAPTGHLLSYFGLVEKHGPLDVPNCVLGEHDAAITPR
jgi:hypothetical protein